MGLLLGNKSPVRRDSIAGVVFTPARGVIHPKTACTRYYTEQLNPIKQRKTAQPHCFFLFAFVPSFRTEFGQTAAFDSV